MKSIREIATYFDKVQWKGSNSFNCLCPSHNDKKASLSITERDSKILMHCHANCDTKDILNLTGLTFQDLGNEKKEYKTSKCFGSNNIIRYDYLSNDEENRYLFSKTREDTKGDKKIRYCVYGKGGTIKSNSKPERLPPLLYNYKSLKLAINNGYTVYYCEGEKDVDTLKRLGLVGTTAGSVSDWKKELAKHFIGAKLVILQDNDAPGEKLANQILKDVSPYVYTVKIVNLMQYQKGGDVTDYINEGYSKDDLLNRIKEVAETYGKSFIPNAKNEYKRHYNRLAKIIIDCYNIIKIIYNEEDENVTLYYYDEENKCYKRLSNTLLLEKISDFYPPDTLPTIQPLMEIAKLVRLNAKRIVETELQKNKYFINFKNGLYDVRERKLKPHDKNIILLNQINANFYKRDPKDEKKIAMQWEIFTTILCSNDDGLKKDMYDALQEWCGLIISNIPGYKVKGSLTLYSAEGNTGKGQFFNFLCELLGSHSSTSIPIQKLNDRWATGQMYGKRLVYNGDLPAEPINDASVYKCLTGGDLVNAERKGEQPFQYVFNGVIANGTNHFPSFKKEKGSHMIERFNIYKCETIIPEEKRDPNLLEKLLEEKDYIVDWCIEGLHRLIDNNLKLTKPQSMLDLQEMKRREDDTVYSFIRAELIEDKNSRIETTVFYEAYKKYCFNEELLVANKRGYHERIEKCGYTVVKSGGYNYVKGLKFH